jgi:NDP-sugar pyrophosphorylase family protein
MNGDLLTTLNFKELYDYHIKNQNDLTISLYKKEIKIDLGVIETDKDKFLNYIEKPIYNFEVSMGIYVINRSLINLIPKNEKYDLPDLVIKANNMKKKIGCFRGNYYWLDIGRVDDYEKANEMFESNKKDFLP